MSDIEELRNGEPVEAEVTDARRFHNKGARQSVVSVVVGGSLTLNNLNYPDYLAKGDKVQVLQDRRSGGLTTRIIGTYSARR